MSTIPRSQVDPRYTWDLTPLYPSLEEWKAHRAELEGRISSVSEFRGRLSESAAVLLEATERYYTLSREIERLYNYAHLQSDQDTGNAENLGYLESTQNLYARFSADASFFQPELLALPEARLEELFSDPVLAPYRRALSEIVRYKPHTLNASEENLIALGSEVFSACDRVFSQLNNADLKFGSVTVDGEERPLTHSSFIVFLQHPNREVRKTAYFQFYREFESHKNTIAATLAGSIKADVYLAKVRKYRSALHHGLFGDNVGEEVYQTLVDTVNEHLPALYRYHERRRELLELPELQLYDTYVPLVPNIQTRFTYEEACEHLIEAFRPLGEEYCSVLARGLKEERWVDVYENKGKRSGAYSSGCYDSPPYMLMNYKEESLTDLFTLAHEAGHSMHSYLTRRSQPYQDSGYTIFVAEVASTFNEQLLLAHLRRVYQSDTAMLRYLANHQVEDTKRTLYRQTMFAEFEKRAHEAAEANQPLTVQTFTDIYGEISRKYSGPSMELPEVAKLECLRIPHFYSAFYVYKYATGLSAAIALSEQVMDGSIAERDRYLNFLRAGCTKFPVDLLRDAGVDVTTPAPIRTALKRFEKVVGEL